MDVLPTSFPPSVASASRPSRWAPSPAQEWALVCGILLLSLGSRLWLSERLPLESDEAIVGLMAKHILEGERPIFYYGQNYMGALEAYLVSLGFVVFGVSQESMRLVTSLLATAFAGVMYFLGRDSYSRPVGIASALYIAVCPAILAVYSIKVRGGYVETLLLGALMLFLLLKVGHGDRLRLLPLCLLGAASGLAFFVSQLSLPYLLAVGLVLPLRLGRRGFIALLIVAAAFVLGSLPLWIFNLQNDLATFRNLSTLNPEGPTPLTEVPRGLAKTAALALPVMLGFVTPAVDPERFAQIRASEMAGFVLSAVAVGLLAVATVPWLMSLARRGGRGLVRGPDLPLLVTAVAAVALYVAIGTANWKYGEPRYLLPLFSATPFLVARVHESTRRLRWLPGLILALALAVNARSLITYVPETIPAAPVVSYLEARGDTRIYGDYWAVYIVAFESRERVVGAAVSHTLELADNRYGPYVEEMRRVGPAPYVFLAGSNRDRVVETSLLERGIPYRRTEVGGFSIYDDIGPPP